MANTAIESIAIYTENENSNKIIKQNNLGLETITYTLYLLILVSVLLRVISSLFNRMFSSVDCSSIQDVITFPPPQIPPPP